MEARTLSLRAVFGFAISGIVAIIIGFMFLFFVGQERRASYWNHVTGVHVPVLKSTQEALIALNDARNAAGVSVTGDYATDIEAINKSEAKFHTALLRFTMYTAALLEGSESDAFRSASGGILFAEWKRQRIDETLRVQAVLPVQAQNIRQLRKHFDDYSGLAKDVFALQRKKALALRDGNDKAVSEIDRDLTDRMVILQNDFNQVITAADELVDTTNLLIDREISTRSADIRRITIQTVAYGILSLFLFGVFGYAFFRRYLFHPLAQVAVVSRTYQEGNLTYRFNRLPIVELDQIAQALNSMAKSLDNQRTLLESRVSERTAELTRAKNQAEEHMALLAKEQKSANDAKLAMLNLLEDARELEAKLRAEGERVKAIVTTMTEGLCVVDNNGKILLMNPSAQKLFGFTEHAPVGEILDDVVRVFCRERELAHDERLLIRTIQTGKAIVVSVEDDYSVETPHGKVPIAGSAVPLLRDGVVVGALATFRDATHEKQEKEAIERQVEERTRELRSEQARLLASINSLVRGFVLTDVKGSIVLTNDLLNELVGPPKTSGWTLPELSARLEPGIYLETAVAECLSTQKPYIVREELVGAKYFEVYVNPIILPDTRAVIGTLILIGDITERKTLERSREEFFSIASHELRTPLTAIRGNTELIRDYYGDKLADATLKEMVDDIHESSIRLIEIVNDFLNVSRLEQNRMTFDINPFDMNDLIARVIAEFQVTGSRRNVALNFESTSPSPVMAWADKDKVREVLINLIGNSLKFTREGKVMITVSRGEKAITVSVTDTGRGIAPAQQSLLFHKFQQAGESLYTRDTTKGTGLGLYISKLILKGMGGKIWLAQSEPDKGSTFSFTVPLAKA